jgi:eukaryotic-like serine/threonine-protein kinase
VTAADPRPLLRSAERDAGRLGREGVPWAEALARLVLAAVAFRRGDAGRSSELLRSGAVACEAAAMRLHTAAARLRLGRQLGGEEGRALCAEADAWMTGQGVRDPARVAALLVPGLPE